MTESSRGLFLVLALCCAAAGTAARPDAASAPARFDNVPARPPGPEDLRIPVAVPPGPADPYGDLRHRARGLGYPIKKDYELVPDILPSLPVRSRSHRTVARPGEPSRAGPGGEDPPASSFWTPSDPTAAELYAGFGRKAVPRYDGVCEYRGPK